MLEERKNIDRLFENGLSTYEEDMPAYTWDNIHSAIKEEKQKKRKTIYWSIAASIALLLAFGLGYFINPNQGNSGYIAEDILHNESTKTTESNNTQKIKKESTPTRTISSEEHISTNQTPVEIKSRKPERINKNIEENSSNKYHASTNNSSNINLQKTNFSLLADIETSLFNNTPKSLVVIDQLKEDKTNNSNIAQNNTPSVDEKDHETKTEPAGALTEEFYTEETEDEMLADNNKSYSKWEVGGQFVPVYAMGNNNPQEQVYADIQSNHFKSLEEETNESNKVAFSTGIGVNYYLKSRWGIQSGFFFSKFADAQEHFEVPALLNYKCIDSKLKVNLVSGLSSGYMLTNENSNYQQLDFNAIAGVGAGLALTDRVSISAQPAIKYHLPFTNSYFINQSPLSFAVFTGITYSL
ncbi:MAG: hypothetical protein C0594_01590 [Marinilabiliales bacterium]|nr:MAG: hypothetical protein C0594_01590 [Marinilabiliales bacterium]